MVHERWNQRRPCIRTPKPPEVGRQIEGSNRGHFILSSLGGHPNMLVLSGVTLFATHKACSFWAELRTICTSRYRSAVHIGIQQRQAGDSKLPRPEWPERKLVQRLARRRWGKIYRLHRFHTSELEITSRQKSAAALKLRHACL